MKLSDLMTAEQALQVLEYIKSLESRVLDLEKKVENLENERSNYIIKEIF